MRTNTLGLLILVAVAQPAYAQTDERLIDAAKCSLVSDSLSRLVCFDKLFPSGGQLAIATSSGEAPVSSEPPPSTSATTEPAINWDIQTEKSPLDDSSRVTAVLMPTKTTGTGIGDSQIALIVRCAENTTSVVVSTSMFMTEEAVAVTVRIGDQPARTANWDRSTNYKAVGLWSGGVAIPFIKALTDNTKLFIRVQAQDRVDGEFDLADASNVRQQVASACGWKP